MEEVISTENASFSIDQVHELARHDLDFLAALAAPDIFKYCFPPVYLTLWNWLLEYIFKERDFSKLALGLPRGFAKTTLLKLFIVFVILFTNRRYILVMSATATLAENILRDVCQFLNEPNIKRVFGDWQLGVERDTQPVKIFGYRGRTIILGAIGAEGSVRGLNIDNARPDVMIFDDVQSRDNADSPIQADKLYNWMLGTAMKAKANTGCLTLFIANMYPTPNSILRKLKNNPTWVKFIAGGILADGTSLWEELQPIAQLVEEFKSDLAAGKPGIFFSEVLNDETASTNTQIDLSKIPEWTLVDGDIPAGNFIIIDPSNDKTRSDNVAIGYFEVHNSKPNCMELIEEKLNPGDIIRTAIRLAIKHNCRVVAIESVAFQYSLLYWSNFICVQMGIEGIMFLEVYPGRSTKVTRIVSMFGDLVKGEIGLHPDVRAQVYLQAMQYNPLRKDNVDDGLDVLTYAHKVIDMYGEFIVSTSNITLQESASVTVEENNTCF